VQRELTRSEVVSSQQFGELLTWRFHASFRHVRSDLDDAEILRRYGFEPDPVIEAYKRDVDRTLLRQNLRRTPEQRWKLLANAARLADELRRAGAIARGG
jgi:hypothetical protein